MLPYFIANILSITFLYIGYHFKFNTKALKAILALSALPLILIAGFKHIKVGTDTASYVHFFNKIQSFNDVISVAEEQGEIGFWLLNYLGHFIADNHYIVFLLSAAIISGCYFYSIKAFNLKTLSLFTLLFIGPYYFQLNGTRQAIAIAIFSISVIFILRKQFLYYLLSILLGFLFHKSMILCLPLYFLFIGDIKPRKVAAIMLLFIILLVFFESFINIAADIDPRYSTYGNKQDQRGGLVVSSFNILLFFWFIICRNVNKQILATRTFDSLLILYLLGALISVLAMVLGVDPSGFLRMSIYFVQMSTFLLPMTILSFRDRNTRYIITFAAVILMTAYFYLTTSTFSNLTPYRFNADIEIFNES